MAVLAKAASSSSNRRGALVFASSGLIITMAATAASATAEDTVSSIARAGEADVSDAAVAALALAPVVAAPADAEFESVSLEASSEPAPVIVEVSRSEERTGAASSSSASTGSSSGYSGSVTYSGSSSAVLSTALSYVGSPYAWGGTTPSGWDCIGFVRYVYAQHGVYIGGYTTSVLSVGRQVPYSEAQPGDILYVPGHVSIYAGGGQNVGAWNPSMGTVVGPNSWLGSTPIVIRVFD